MTSDTKCGSLRASFRLIHTVIIMTFLLLVALAVAGTAYVRQAVHHIDIDPIALSDTMRDAVILTIREGSREQKLETIASLETVGATDAAPFVPALKDATKDPDPQVRQAAKSALDRIVPKAIEEKEETRDGKVGEDRTNDSGNGPAKESPHATGSGTAG
jgi:hypothetical protein